MQLTKGAIGNLINRYKAVLKKCHLMNTFGSLAVAGMLVMGGAGVAGAAITTGQDFQDAVTKAKPGDTIMLGQDIKEGLGAVFRGCPACFLILKGVVISSHETNRFS